MNDEAPKEGQQTPEEAKPVELTEEALAPVAGGRKAGKSQLEYFVVTMKEVIITGVS